MRLLTILIALFVFGGVAFAGSKFKKFENNKQDSSSDDESKDVSFTIKIPTAPKKIVRDSSSDSGKIFFKKQQQKKKIVHHKKFSDSSSKSGKPFFKKQQQKKKVIIKKFSDSTSESGKVIIKKKQQKKNYYKKKYDKSSSSSENRRSSASFVKQEKKKSEPKVKKIIYESESSNENFIWGYSRKNGPHTWSYYYPSGQGHEQSPVNIPIGSPSVGHDRLLRPLKFNYTNLASYTVENTGRGFRVNFDSDDNTVTGGPILCKKYVFDRMQLHWGKNKHQGSLHFVNGSGFAAELVLAHYNKEKYGTFDKAAKHKDGLLYVSVFVTSCQNDNNAFSDILKALNTCLKPGDKAVLKNKKHGFSISDILPKNFNAYWTYPGSMAEPPLFESVTWVVLRDSIDVSSRQLASFRNLYPYNVRPLQGLANRVIRSSFSC